MFVIIIVLVLWGGFFVSIKSVVLDLGGEYPSYLEFYSGVLRSVSWRVNNQLHRENDLPALIDYNHDGGLSILSWFCNGFHSRKNDLPITLWFHENGNVSFVKFLSADEVFNHRVAGPLSVNYDKHGNITNENYYVNGSPMNKEQWMNHKLVKEHFRNLKNTSKGTLATDISF